MNRIVIDVGRDRPEDDLIDLVEILAKQFPDQIVRSSAAVVIETDVPSVAAMFRVLAATEWETPAEASGNGSKPKTPKKYQCIECGKPVYKKGNRCGSCNNLHKKKIANVEVADEGAES
jgi:rubrerythrin